MRSQWETCVAFAEEHHGCLTVEQAVLLGFPESAVHRRARNGDLEKVLPGVYRVPGAPDGLLHRARALTLWGGEESAASHSTGAQLLGLSGVPENGTHIVSTRQFGRLPSWAQLHHVGSPPVGVRPVAGIPVVPPWRVLLDLAQEVPAPTLRVPFIDALCRRLTSVPQMEWAVKTYGLGHPGTAAVRALLAECIGKGLIKPPPESKLEELLYALIEPADLPKSVRQFRIWDGTRWRRLDLAFLELLIAVEVDGWGVHGTWESFQDDRARDAALSAMGWITLRFTWFDLTLRPDEVLATIHRTVEVRMKAAGGAA